MTDTMDDILESILADDSPLTAEDMETVRQFDAVIAVAKERVAVEAIVERYLNGALYVAGKGHDAVPVNLVARHIREMGDEISTVMRKGGDFGMSFDMDAAPRGQYVTKTVPTGKDANGNPKTKAVQEFVPDYIWAASNCGKVLKSFWKPATVHHNGYFSGFPSDPKYGSGPIAWQPYIVPAHPDLTGETETPRSDGGLDLVHVHSEINLPIIDDVGSV